MNKPISMTITIENLKARTKVSSGLLGTDVDIDGSQVIRRMLAAGIPVVGVDSILTVARGELTIEHDDGLNGDEWTISYAGRPIREDVRHGPHGQVSNILLITDLPMKEYAAELRVKYEEDEL